MALSINTQLNEANDLQQDLTYALGLLRNKHPVVEATLSSYLYDRPMDDFDIFSLSAYSNYFKQHGPLLKKILAQHELKHFKQQFKYYKALILIMGILAEDPSIMDSKESEELKKITLVCIENTAKLRYLLSDAINEKLSPLSLRKRLKM